MFVFISFLLLLFSSTYAVENTLKEKLQSTLTSKMSTDCFSKTTSESCQGTYCVWYNNGCVPSPGFWSLVCRFYCDEPICEKPSEGSCYPKESTVKGLCGAITSDTTCNNQEGICAWNTTTCQDAPSSVLDTATTSTSRPTKKPKKNKKKN